MSYALTFPGAAVLPVFVTEDRKRGVHVRTERGHPYVATVYAPGHEGRRIVCPPECNTHARAQAYARADVDTFGIDRRVRAFAAAGHMDARPAGAAA